MSLKLILVAMVPTGAAIIYFLWSYRRRKVPSLEPTWKSPSTTHSFFEHLVTLESVESGSRRTTLPGSYESCESTDFMYIIEDHLISNIAEDHAASELHQDNGCSEDAAESVEKIKTSHCLSNKVTEFPCDVGSSVAENDPVEVAAIHDGSGEGVERCSSLEEEPGTGCMTHSGNGMTVNGIEEKECLPISEEILEDLLKQDVVSEYEIFEMHGPSQLMPGKEDCDGYPRVATVNKPASVYRNSIGCFRDFDKVTSSSLSEQEIRRHSSSLASQDSAVISFGNKNKAEQVKKKWSQHNKKLMDSISTVYKFDFPSELCGRLIGRQGKNVGMLKRNSGADLFLQTKLYSTQCKVVCLQGTQQQVNKALHLIKKKFPEKKFHGVDYEKHSADVPPESVGITQLSMPVGAPLDVVVSNVIDANHLFLHLPSHPTFSKLEMLTASMKKCYNLNCCVPDLPRPIEVGVICVAPAFGFWYRAQILEVHPEEDEYDIKLVDYGGYLRLRGSTLKQIRKDFMDLPFQAVECYLANVVASHENEGFSKEAKQVMEKLVDGNILQAEVVAVEHDGIPYVELTCVQDCQMKFVNRELINCGVAKWAEM